MDWNQLRIDTDDRTGREGYLNSYYSYILQIQKSRGMIEHVK